MHFNGSDKNDNQMDHCDMFAEDVALFDYHFYQSCCNWRRELCSQTILHLFLRFSSILPESTYLLGFYCTASTVHKIMLLALTLYWILAVICQKKMQLAWGFSLRLNTRLEMHFNKGEPKHSLSRPIYAYLNTNVHIKTITSILRKFLLTI